VIKGQTEIKLTSDMLGSNPQFSVAVLINGIDYYNNRTNLTTFNVQFSVGSTSDSPVALSDNESILYGSLIGFCVFLLFVVRRSKKQQQETSSGQQAVSPSLLLH
jgi:hypothetical protein